MTRFGKLTDSDVWQKVFVERFQPEMKTGARASLDESLRDLALSPPELCSYLYLHEHHRRFTVPSLELFRNALEIRLPFADEEFLAALLSGKPEWRDSTELHRAIVSRYDARLLSIRDSNTGVPANAGPAVTFVGDKLNTVLKRLNVWGYRHYHNFEGWMEARLFESVETELLSPRSLDRGLLRREGVRALLEGARKGQRGYANTLQVLLILEIWQQQNVDRATPSPSSHVTP
jgi:hypothetical protein